MSDKSWWKLELDWKRMESSWKVDGKKLEIIGKDWRTCSEWMGLEGTAVMRGRAGNARLMGQMMYDRWFSF